MKPNPKLKLVATEEADDGNVVWLGLRTSTGIVLNHLAFSMDEPKDRRRSILARSFFAAVATDPEMHEAVLEWLQHRSDVGRKPVHLARLAAQMRRMGDIYERAGEKL